MTAGFAGGKMMPTFDFEEGYRRLDAAMTGGCEEVPFIAQMHEFSMVAMAERGDKFYTDAETFVRGICTTTHDFGFDTPSFIWDAYNVEAEALGVKLVTFKDMAPALDNVDPLIRTETDLARLKSPDPASAGRMPFVAEVLHLVKEHTGRRSSLGFCAPFTMAAHLMTFENLIVQIKQNPAFVHKVMGFIVDEVLVPYCQYMHKQFPDLRGFDGSDATASLPFITLEMQEEFALGPIERLQKQLDIPAYVDNWWGDSFIGDKERFWESKLRVTPGYFKIQDPDLWKIGLSEPMEFARRKDKSVVLGIDNNLFQNGPEEAIRQRVHEYLEVIEEAGGKGCVYFCSLSAVTPRAHVEIAIDAVRQFRAGERPWAGERRAGTAEARGATAKKTATATVALPRPGTGKPLSKADEAAEQRLDEIYDTVMDCDDQACPRLVREALDEGIGVYRVLDDALIAAMDEIGDMFSDGVIFVPEMLMAARAMKAGLQVVRPILTETGEPPKGKVLLATVQGDVHDIGKNLVGMMLEGAGYEVVDLGVNATPEDILANANAEDPDVVGLSALLTTSMPSMQKTVALFKQTQSKYPVIVGGAPVTQTFADHIDADGYGENAPQAVETVHRLVAARSMMSAVA
jgi:5-methyltetrahydrofolate--homocysteine methyltransferase